MKVLEDQWLSDAKRLKYPAGPEMKIRRFGIAHFTAGAAALSSYNFWLSGEARGAEAHVIIDRDGTVYQIRPFNQRCDHAGTSTWSDPKTGRVFTALNSCTIGVEFANAGDSARADGTAFTRFKLPAGVIQARHKNGGPVKSWECYPEPQILAGIAVFKAITARYNLDDLVGHEDIAPKRKVDPGPAFPMTRIRLACGFPASI
ncbi:N-acetylmuramoyl-L-alanine amidase [Luteolibacter sp. GHJ8]|uniref:N-acetylmuramoyl-L-alanine amidase n=1 Tax=Luteolibacter rhizosphaerae TaxID=2989719 RepID=A0ABT3GB92_9BACT|nr:N-acetylmuramoyl-L-alanine amidase [Luteolibacter rhizosphaerae]MCW1917055.1 N-acetylmuramoyl-L-alanine amidase [Luteolibacter rhizosphaerae]